MEAAARLGFAMILPLLTACSVSRTEDTAMAHSGLTPEELDRFAAWVATSCIRQKEADAIEAIRYIAEMISGE